MRTTSPFAVPLTGAWARERLARLLLGFGGGDQLPDPPDALSSDPGRPRSAILTSVAKKRHNGREATGSCLVAGIGQQQELDEMLLDRGAVG
jgi:hypothetical protein